MLRSFLALALLFGSVTSSGAQARADFAGVDLFWPIADRLAADSEPSPDQWRQLLDAPAYRQLDRDARLQRMYRLAYQPSYQRERDSVLSAGTYDAMVLRHLRGVPPQRAVLQRFRDSLAAIDLVGEANRLAATYLPPGELTRRAPPAIAFGFFGPEAYGGRSGITMDFQFARDRGPHFLPIVGHEVHHVHVDHITRLRFPARAAPEFTLLQALRNLANEGTADRINLRFPVAPPAMTAEASPAYNAAYDGADTTLRTVDLLLSQLGSDTAQVRRAGREISARLVYAGHPVGAYMAEHIEAQLGREALVAAVGNPFAFFRLYNEAAGRMRGTRPFSSATLDAVADLERRFLDSPSP